VVRHRGDGEDPDLGVLYDCRHVNGRLGYSATVFRTNLFTMPTTEDELFELPKEVFDSPEEMAAAGWVVD
jgi:hypothetical protein